MTAGPAEFYAGLPAKRLGAGVLFVDEQGQVLLVEPVYKPTWEIPGGLVEAGESPLQAAVREVREELGIEVARLRLWCVDWHPAEPPKTEGVMLIFDGGRLTPVQLSQIALPPGELSSSRFVSVPEAASLLAPGLHARVSACLSRPGETLYLESGRPAAT